MKYEKARNLVFDYFIKEKELNNINNDINRFKRFMPYDNGPASEYTMELMDVEIKKKVEIENDMKILKEEIELLLRVFK